MRVIICGSRDLNITMEDINSYLTEIGLWDDCDCVISGVSGNVDMMALEWANEMQLSNMKFFAQWEEFGNAAGPMRNELMAKHGEACVAFWDGKSRGTKHMFETARKLGLPTFVKVMK